MYKLELQNKDFLPAESFSNSIGDDLKEIKKDGIKGFGRVLADTANKFNPLAQAPRAGALEAVRLNMFGIATRLYPAFLNESQLKSGHFDLENAKKAKLAWEKVKKKWMTMGGSPSALEKRIKSAHDSPAFNTKKNKARQEQEGSKRKGGSRGAGTVLTGGSSAGVIAMGTPIIVGLIQILDKSGVKKNPYTDKNINTEDFNIPNEDTVGAEQAISQVENLAAEERKAGLPLDEGDSTTSGDKIWGIPKPIFYIGSTALAIGAIYGIIKLVKASKKG